MPILRLAASLALCLIASSAIAQTPAKGNAEDGSIKAYSCTGCHGVRGYKNVYPHYHVPQIGGQNYDYLIAALKGYREGTRHHPTMQAQAMSFSEQDISDIAAYLSSLSTEGDATNTGAVGNAEAGKAVAVVCQACHGIDGNGIGDPQYPLLARQHADYLVKALEDYKSGKRDNAIMKGFASTLSSEDIANIAAYFASQKGTLRDLVGVK